MGNKQWKTSQQNITDYMYYIGTTNPEKVVVATAKTLIITSADPSINMPTSKAISAVATTMDFTSTNLPADVPITTTPASISKLTHTSTKSLKSLSSIETPASTSKLLDIGVQIGLLLVI